MAQKSPKEPKMTPKPNLLLVLRLVFGVEKFCDADAAFNFVVTFHGQSEASKRTELGIFGN